MAIELIRPLAFASSCARPEISDEMINGRIIIFSMFISISPGNVMSATVCGVGCAVLTTKPSTAPNTTARIVSSRSRFFRIHLPTCNGGRDYELGVVGAMNECAYRAGRLGLGEPGAGGDDLRLSLLVGIHHGGHGGMVEQVAIARCIACGNGECAEQQSSSSATPSK